MLLQATVIPTGGVIGITFSTAISGNISLSRAISGVSGLGPFTTLYSGVPYSSVGGQCYYLDVGDQSPGPLLTNVSYVYQLTDITGTQTTNPIAPVTSMTIDSTPWTRIIIGIIQGAVNSATLPPGINMARVFNAMPMVGNPPLPLIAINPELEVQANIPIGADDPEFDYFVNPALTTNSWTQAGQERRMFRITVCSLSAEERDFWRRFIIGTLRIAAAYALSQAGADFIRDYEAVSYQASNETKLQEPGWYCADILWDMTVEANVTITTNYGLIETITAAISGYTDDLQVSAYSEYLKDNINFTTTDGEEGPPVLTVVTVPIVSGVV
jgi:hypothetical protein